VRRRIGAKHLLGAWAVVVFAFLYVPIFTVIAFAFDANRYATRWTHFTTAWFGRALNDSRYTGDIKVSLKIAILNSIIATVLGTMAALALARMRRRSRVPFDVIVYLTLVVPEIVIAVATLIFFVQMRNELGSVFPRLGWVTILIAHVVFNASIVMLIVRARFVGMGQTLEEASFDLGAGPIATFRQVTLPRLAPAIMAGALLAFTFSFDDYVISAFNAGGQTETWPMAIWNDVRFGVTPKINALATMMFCITVLGILATGAVLRRGRRGHSEEFPGLSGLGG
jgi:ABC-type spermidine/putrescine transport system permease subunit II